MTFPDLALPPIVDTRVQTAKRTAFRMDCPGCQKLTLDLKRDLAKQNYQDTLALWGEYDEDAPRDYKALSKASKDHDRLSRAIARDTPNVDKWELIDMK